MHDLLINVAMVDIIPLLFYTLKHVWGLFFCVVSIRTSDIYQLPCAHILTCKIVQHEKQPFAISDEKVYLKVLFLKFFQINIVGTLHCLTVLMSSVSSLKLPSQTSAISLVKVINGRFLST